MKEIYIILNASDTTESLLPLAEQVIRGGASYIQFRYKGKNDSRAYTLAKKLHELCQKFHVPLIINDRVDIAYLLDADGVHLGQTDLPIEEARKILGKDKIIGGTASNLEELKKIINSSASYIGFGHVYTTTTKHKPYPPRGIQGLKEAIQHSRLPIVAVGGITRANLHEVIQEGVHGIAICSAISSSTDPYLETKALVQIWKDTHAI